MNTLNGKRALVCGASRGIGRACAIALAEQGADVVLAARSKETLELALEEVKRRSPSSQQQHHTLLLDLTRPEEAAAAVKQMVSTTGTVHILVNNTGGPAACTTLDISPTVLLQNINAHLLAAHLLAQALIPGMQAARYGRIINILSTSVKQPIPNLSISNVIRPSVASWGKSLSNEVAKFGITVNNILPGPIGTDRLKELTAQRAKRSGQSVEEIFASMADEVPVGRIGQPEDIAYGCAFLASPQASYINGINLPIDGGRTSSL